MLAYRFRVLHEEDEHFYREIEIKADQTFEDLHLALQKCIAFEGNELASFFVCGDDWQKLEEITLLDMSEEENPIATMKTTKIKEKIASENQKLIYEYNFLNPLTFFIKLMKTYTSEPKVKYPRCVGTNGSNAAPIHRKTRDELDEELLREFNELLQEGYSDTDAELD